jgi:GDP-L-fucose synthase
MNVRKSMINKTVVITGGDGFLGHHLVPLVAQEYTDVEVARKEYYDLLKTEDVKGMYHELKPDIVIHLAAVVGGIQFNQKNPAQLFHDNIKMGVDLIHEGMVARVEKFVCIGTVCMYPIFSPIPFKEEDIWNGYPEPTNAPYAISKRSLEVMCRAYRQQYGMNTIFLLPCNMFGPFDTFTNEQGHVIPMLIKRFIEAKEQNLSQTIVWGTGQATREFLYVEDCAKMILEATNSYNDEHPMNLGSGKETSIAELAGTIARLVDYKGQIVWDDSMPDGQPRRFLDISRSMMYLGFQPEQAVSLEEGLKKTIDWYLENRK